MRRLHRLTPMTSAIGLALLADRDVLRLRSRLLIADVRERFGVDYPTAAAAIELARKAAPEVRPLTTNPERDDAPDEPRLWVEYPEGARDRFPSYGDGGL